MLVKLLKDVLEGGQVKTTVRKSRKQVIGWFEGAEIDVSDATGDKLIAAGIAEAVQPVQETQP